MRKDLSDRPWLWIGPCVCLIIALFIFPLVYSLILSFCDWDISSASGPTYVGFGNYVRISTDNRFWINLRNTLLIVAGAGTLEIVLGFLLALLLSRELTGKGLFRTLLVMPMMMMPIVAGSIWKTLFHFQAGPINHLLAMLGLSPVQWLMKYPEGIYSIVITDVWQWTPFVAFVLLAGIQSLPQEPYDSARVDGASEWSIFRFLTLPLLKPILITVALLRVIEIFRIFDIVFVLTGGGPGISTETLTVGIYHSGLRDFRIGYACAFSYVLVLLASILTRFFFKHSQVND